MYVLAPSILAADFGCLREEITAVTEAGAEYIHLDVMDGAFVPSISMGMPVIQSVRKTTDKFLDVHLMIEEPGRYIEDFVSCGADGITVHVEACKHLDRTIMQIREAGLRAGVALNPATPLNSLECILDKIDMILLMSVNPGFGGQQYIESTTGKIKNLREQLSAAGNPADIQVDGGISAENARMVLEAGANILVAGSAVFKGNKRSNVEDFLEVFETCIH